MGWRRLWVNAGETEIYYPAIWRPGQDLPLPTGWCGLAHFTNEFGHFAGESPRRSGSAGAGPHNSLFARRALSKRSEMSVFYNTSTRLRMIFDQQFATGPMSYQRVGHP